MLLKAKNFNIIFIVAATIFLGLYLWRRRETWTSQGEPEKMTSSMNNNFPQYIIDVYKKQSPERAQQIFNVYNSGWDVQMKKGYYYILMVPEVHCGNKVRIGNVADGGKWMCDPMAIKDDCAIFSLGVLNDISFEEEIQALTKQKCVVHSYDKNSPSQLILDIFPKINGDFTEALISNVDNKTAGTRSIKSELKRFNLDRVEILKIDIEGAELQALPPLLEEVVICQILIEIHATPTEFVDFIVFMAKKGYRMFHFEINGLSMDLCEFSFIHDTCIDQFNVIPLAYFWELIGEMKDQK